MRFTARQFLLLLTVATGATASAGQAAAQVAVPGVPDEPLQKRDCVYNGCRCDSRGEQFHSCGNCEWIDTGAYVITEDRVLTNIYECAPDGSCCDYGYASDCGTANARCGQSG